MIQDQQTTEPKDDVEIGDLTAVLEICKRLSPTGRQRLIETISTFFALTRAGFSDGRGAAHQSATDLSSRASADVKEISPKEFVLRKQPSTGVERVACLAYYLTHYRDTPHFKTLEISKLNTEAAQPKFANAALAVNDATKTGYLIPVTKGNKQLSAAGELFVQALPDRQAAKAAMASARPRKKRRANQVNNRRTTSEDPNINE